MAKSKRELAVVNIRTYPSTHSMLKEMSQDSGKSIARENDEAVRAAYKVWKESKKVS